ncbi:hypothetical protein W97_07499 [Coniosporium apollinis CBS 100218]|uniref:Uncharacterized protein n=1 Tax=Coniosporium apollinis (strain CBS 100218) TaxID=1168221 RepID=R7Z2U4_CONA1|nr:uncharacterized protein W97_07499 [Coniosporium apollinis CBS 100218]EON68241.1 hypothetical protein W97_07499 [Coniosporium apollinis CBS 100218]
MCLVKHLLCGSTHCPTFRKYSPRPKELLIRKTTRRKEPTMCLIETRTYVASGKSYEYLHRCPLSDGSRPCHHETRKETIIQDSRPSSGSFRLDGDSRFSTPPTTQPPTPTTAAVEYREPAGLEQRSSKRTSRYVNPEIILEFGSSKRKSAAKKYNRRSGESSYSSSSDRVAIMPQSPLRSPYSPHSPFTTPPEAPNPPPAVPNFPMYTTGAYQGYSSYNTAATSAYTTPASPSYNTTTAVPALADAPPAKGTITYAYPPPLATAPGSGGAGGPPRPPRTITAAAAPDEPSKSPSSARQRRTGLRVSVTNTRPTAPPESATASPHDEDADIRFRDTGREELRRRHRRSQQAAEKAAAEAEARRAAQEEAERVEREAQEDALREKDRLTARDTRRREDEWTRKEAARLADRERQRDAERRKRDAQERRRRDSEAAAKRAREQAAKEAREAAARDEAEAQRRRDEYHDLLRRMEREKDEAARWAAEEEAEKRRTFSFESPSKKREQRRDSDAAAASLRREKLAAEIRRAEADVRRTEADVAYWTARAARASAPMPEPESPTLSGLRWGMGRLDLVEPELASPLRGRGGGGRGVVVHSPVEEPLGESLRERGERVIARERVRRGTGSGGPYLEDGWRGTDRTYRG